MAWRVTSKRHLCVGRAEFTPTDPILRSSAAWRRRQNDLIAAIAVQSSGHSQFDRPRRMHFIAPKGARGALGSVRLGEKSPALRGLVRASL